MQKIVFIDTEVGITDKKVHDIGAVSMNNSTLHTAKVEDLVDFVKEYHFIGGHNLIHHDLKFLPALTENTRFTFVDTLYVSPLVFPKRPYHKLLKDDKLQTDELNNPVNDSKKARELLIDEVEAFNRLPDELKHIFYQLLKEQKEFKGFFEFVQYSSSEFRGRNLLNFFRRDDYGIKDFFKGRICANAEIDLMIRQTPTELAYALALIHAGDSLSIIPPWTLKNYPRIYDLILLLKNKPCEHGCDYCREKLNAFTALHKYFGYEGFRSYNGEPLQQQAVEAAIAGKSLLVVFPTGGGKSLTFQLPALMAGENAHGLTVVISPLQSLMKDQVDNLQEIGVTGAVTVNGLLSPIERADAFKRIADGSASILYISPEMLRSKTVERMLMQRNVVRFVIDEAHCFSSWGQDFRIDYLYIGDFIKKLQQNKGNGEEIAVSCFTATAKQKVITDIQDYFKNKLNLTLELFASTASRTNLTYNVLYKETEEDKYTALRNLIEQKNCPTIVYVSRTKRSVELAKRLTADGFGAKPFNGKMTPKEKIENQEAFIRNDIGIIVATSAFGMGVDKKDIGLVIHYDISDSLENYIQESGRAGRDVTMEAECFVLYNDADLDKHFILLNQTKLSISEIQQVWRAIKSMTGTRRRICCSPLEIARQAGWDNSVPEIETRVKTAIGALENAGYIRRGNNMPRIYATGIQAKNVDEAFLRIDHCKLLENEDQQEKAKRIIKSMISKRSKASAGNDDAESRVDYLADTLGIKKAEVISIVNAMREETLLADTLDMSAYLPKEETSKHIFTLLERFAKLEKFILEELEEGSISEFNLKELNAKAETAGIPFANVKNMNTILYFLTTKQFIRKEEYKGSSCIKIIPLLPKSEMFSKFDRRINICKFIIDKFNTQKERLSKKAEASNQWSTQKEILVNFSLVGLYKEYCATNLSEGTTQKDVEDALLFLATIRLIRLEGGFLVVYNGMEINRLEMDNRIRYKREDYASLHEFYTQKVQQVHIVGEFANMMVKDYQAAIQFVNDYFHMDYRKFINLYFKGDRAEKLNHNMTTQRYQKLFGCLSKQQKQIIDDNESKHIVVVAGPGSGKTRVLVHKLAAMLTLEDIKHEQLLMVTFSRAAATEFKIRLKELIGNAANFVEIKTFHSYCFDLMGKIGNLDDSKSVVRKAVQMIQDGEVEPERIAKSVLVIDEAQDMDQDEYDLIRALMSANDGMRVIAVGDDDQNIYEFRGSDSKYMRSLIIDYEARMYELVENYRSKDSIVRFANQFAKGISKRLKNREVVAVSKEKGTVCMTSHANRNMECTLTNQLKQQGTQKSSCIMTTTNDEAFRILGLLLKEGIRAKLIQSNDGFSLSNIAEIRYFIKKFSTTNGQSTTSQSPIITDDEWKDAREQLEEEYKDSSCIDLCKKLLDTFEALSNRKYRTDFMEFLKESQLEDFYPEEQGAVYVSTIHKSKGREFDNVYIMLNNVETKTDEELRKLYVGFTRARENLYIHYFQTPLLDKISAPYIQRYIDNQFHAEPEEIALQLNYKDVVLSFFKDKKRDILSMHCGHPLYFEPGGLTAMVHGKYLSVVRFSKACNQKIHTLLQKGYVPIRAEIRLIVAWKGEEDTTESAVILPNIYMRKS